MTTSNNSNKQSAPDIIKEALEIMHRIRMHVKNDNCQCCKDALI